VFVDEFWVNYETYAKYNWAARGDAAVIPIKNYIKPLSVVVAVTKRGLVLIRPIQKHANSDDFCEILRQIK